MKRLRRTALGFAIAVGILAVAIGAARAWAATAKDSSQVARTLLWLSSDVDDWQRFPARTVPAAPEPVTFASAADRPLDAWRHTDGTRLEAYLERTATTAFLALHDDELLAELYANGSSRGATQTSFSVAKSFVSTLLGIAIAEGFVGGLDDPITAYVPELLARDPRFADIRLRHLVTMRSGLRYRDTMWPLGDPSNTYYAPDLRAAALERSVIEEPPGQTFLYNNYNPLLLGLVLERATDMPVADYLATRLWQPMGAEAAGSWSLDSDRSGFEKMESGINGRAIDFLKLGWLFLHGGRNGDRQVVPADWVEEATRSDERSDPAEGYRYFWWVDAERGGYAARGKFCQVIYVYPPAELVLVRMGRTCGRIDWYTQLGEIAEWLAPRVGARSP